MKIRNLCYIKINKQENMIFSCGMPFEDFMRNISVQPDNILLMDGEYFGGEYHLETGFEYVEKKNLEDLINDNVYNYGDFCWMDYKSKNQIDNLTPRELSELLYLVHRHEPLESPFSSKLNNRYTYIAHDDYWWTRVYMKDINDYRNVIKGKILKELKGRKRTIEDIPDEIVEVIFKGAEYGLYIDFENVINIHGSTGVSLFKVGNYRNYDTIHEVFNRKKNVFSNSLYLNYEKKKWSLHGEWK